MSVWTLFDDVLSVTSMWNSLLSSINSPSSDSKLHLYFMTTVSCLLVGLSSMFSLFIFSTLIQRNPLRRNISESQVKDKKLHKNVTIPPDNVDFDDPSKSEILKLVLSFAVGGLLGDVFLHILPEASVELNKFGYSIHQSQNFIGFWILLGLLMFATAESAFHTVMLPNQHFANEPSDKKKSAIAHQNKPSNAISDSHNQNGLKKRKVNTNRNGSLQEAKSCEQQNEMSRASGASNPVNITAYLNLLANGFDNFTHGMSVGASFLVSIKMGILTTIAIAIHEIPHEIADYVILVRSGFSCWDAFRAQLSLSSITILGSVMIIYFDDSANADTMSYTLWILPLTAGGFIYIALTSLLPELLTFSNGDQSIPKEGHCEESTNHNVTKENGSRRSTFGLLKCLILRIVFVLFGIFTMAAVNAIDSAV